MVYSGGAGGGKKKKKNTSTSSTKGKSIADSYAKLAAAKKKDAAKKKKPVAKASIGKKKVTTKEDVANNGYDIQADFARAAAKRKAAKEKRLANAKANASVGKKKTKTTSTSSNAGRKIVNSYTNLANAKKNDKYKNATTGADIKKEKVANRVIKPAPSNTSSGYVSSSNNVKTISNDIGTGGTGNANTGDNNVIGDVVVESTPVNNAINEINNTTGTGNENTTRNNALQSAIDIYLENIKKSNEANFNANIEGIKQDKTTRLAEQDIAKRDAEKQFLDNLSEINQGIFDADQAGKVREQSRGIANSQQGEALRQGIAREGIGLRFKNAEDRTNRIADITDRISAIKSNALSAIEQAKYQKQAADSKGIADASVIGMQREFQVEDREDNQAFTKEMNDNQFTRDLAKMSIANGYDIEKMNKSFVQEMAKASQVNQWNINAADAANIAAIDRMRLSNAQAVKMFGLSKSYDFAMTKFNYSEQAKIKDMDFERTKELAQLDEKSQYRIMDYSQHKSQDMIEYQTKLNYDMQKHTTMHPFETKEEAVMNIMKNKQWIIDYIGFVTPRLFNANERQTERVTNYYLRKAEKEVDTMSSDDLENMSSNIANILGYGTVASQKESFTNLEKDLGWLKK